MSKKSQMKLQKREQGFDLSSVPFAKLKEYNALSDTNMRHYFENKKIQRLLFTTGQIDRHGRIIEPAKNLAKVNIFEREFREAEKIEERRLKDEQEMRYRVQKKRFHDLERTRKEEILRNVKMDRELSKEIMATIKSATAYAPPDKTKNLSNSNTFSSTGQNALTSSGFFATNYEDNSQNSQNY